MEVFWTSSQLEWIASRVLICFLNVAILHVGQASGLSSGVQPGVSVFLYRGCIGLQYSTAA